jgi:hypothetical protein
MSKEKNNDEVYRLRDLISILILRKWWAISAFLIVLIIGLTISFLKTPQYMLSETIKVTDNYIYYNDLIYKYFPEESEDLWFAPEGQEFIFEKKSLVYIMSIIHSDSFIDALRSDLNNRFSEVELRDLLDTSISEKFRHISLVIVHDDPDEELDIIEAANIILKESIKARLESVRMDTKAKLDRIIIELEDELRDLIDRNSEEDKFLNLEIEKKQVDYYELLKVRDILENNIEMITDRVEVVNYPERSDIVKIANTRRDILFSIFSAALLSIVAAFVTNYILIVLKNKRK